MWQKLKNYYHLAQAFYAAVYYRFPAKELTVIGVTGTDGKTTTVNLIFHILNQAGYKASMVSSIGAQIGVKNLDTGFHVTTPNPFQVQKLLREAVDAKSKYIVLECTSHGLEQNRLALVNFKIGVVTNITSDHMDYHKNWQNYAQAKAKLFKNVKYSIINKDDDSYKFLKNRVSGEVISYSQNSPNAKRLKSSDLSLSLSGEYNRSNALAAVSTAKALGISDDQIFKSLKTFPEMPGRIQEIKAGQEFRTIVDFAHTANSLKKVLSSLKTQKKKKAKLIVMFGAAGERDKSKRPLMGGIAAKLADVSVLTAEDPRSENVSTIISEISSGFKKAGKKLNKDYFQIPDRKKAINFVISLASKNDIVVLLGKGHEKSMTFGKKELPWNEVKEAKNAIKAIQGK